MELNEFEKDLIYDALKSYRWTVVQKDLHADQHYNYRRLLVIEQLLDKLEGKE